MIDSSECHDIVALVDIDGTVSDTAAQMTGFNERLAAAFPAIGAALPHIIEQRANFRQQYGHLSFVEQDEIWQRLYPGTTSHSQLDIYRAFAPSVFDHATTAAVAEWASDPANFGFAEYDDVQPMLAGLRALGAPVVLFTLGQLQTASGAPGWQQLKIRSAPALQGLRSYVSETFPPVGGKGTAIAQSYDADAAVFRIPTTDGGAPITARNVVLVDDSPHNLAMPDHSLGLLIDREGRRATWSGGPKVHIIRSLVEVPAAVQIFMTQIH